VDHPSTIDDVVDFVLEFMNSDVVGLISINHLVIADQSHPGGVLLDADCLELAKLHSKAVDYQKTGSPVGLDQIPKLKFRERPDWHAGEMRDESGSAYYPSQTAIGKLFRAVKLPDIDTLLKHKDDTHSALSDQWIWRPLNNKVQKILGQDHASHTRDDLEKIFTQFSIEFRYILCNHTISESRSAQLSEEEVFIGTINTKCAQPRRRKDMITRMRDQTTELVSSIREDLMGESGRSLEESLKDAWAAWRFSLDKGNAGLPGMKSFGWIALGLVCEFIELYDQRPRT
jgi:RNA-dependent RNA polymerase